MPIWIGRLFEQTLIMKSAIILLNKPLSADGLAAALLNHWPKTPVISGIAPQRADSTRYRASILDPARMHELRCVPTAIMPRLTMQWVPHNLHFSALLFSNENKGSMSICAKFTPNFADAKHHGGWYAAAVHSRCSIHFRLRLQCITRAIGLMLRRFLLQFFVPKNAFKVLSDNPL